jgi:hypothetical protein
MKITTAKVIRELKANGLVFDKEREAELKVIVSATLNVVDKILTYHKNISIK